MKNIRFLSENFQFLEVKFSIYLNRRVFVMYSYGASCAVKQILRQRSCRSCRKWKRFKYTENLPPKNENFQIKKF